jgi:Thiopurine S-methyltransferase (TPMT)
MSAHQETNEFARWEARFATPDYAFGKEPNYFLKSCQQILPRRGRALAVADGEGRNGVWLAEQGLDVVSLDFSPAAQNKARALPTCTFGIIRKRPSTSWSRFSRNSASRRSAQ